MVNESPKRDLIAVLTSQYEILIGKPFLYDAKSVMSLFEVLELANKYPVTVERILFFVEKNKEDMTLIFNKDRYPEFKTPETILIYFYLVHYESYLRRVWWRSDQELKLLYQVFGYSFGNY